MRFLLFEDPHADSMSPIALLRPVFELICGRESLRRRVQRWFPQAACGLWVREWLADTCRESTPAAAVNDLPWLQSDATLLINGRWLPEARLNPSEFSRHNAGFIDGHLAWVLLQPDELRLLNDGSLWGVLFQIASARRIVEATGRLVRYPWDLVNENEQQLIRDFRDEGVSQTPQCDHVQVLGDPADVYVSPLALIDPYVVIDARTGPVSIDRDVQIQSFTRIGGPCHIARGSQIFRAQIRGGTTIGETCRVGGEIEATILHGYVNKYHEGFIGHSYVCPWVNLGAASTTSDMKNDYSIVRVPLAGQPIETDSTKVGSFIGDHTKTAIDSMFNTGSSIGIMSMVLPGGRLLPRHIPSFCNVRFGELATDWSLDDCIATARIAMQRRGQQLTAATETLIRTIFRMTESERAAALDRAIQKRMQT